MQRHDAPSALAQKRALFYAFDAGSGLGHLRRLSAIAGQLQGRFACLLVTGHRAAANWFVPEECEYVHLPSWDAIVAEKARYWNRQPFLSCEIGEARELRRQILAGVVRGFRPDAIFVDHLPLGAEEELDTILRRVRCRKYFVTRGVLNETEELRRLILGGKAREYLATLYDRIFVAGDRRVFDFVRQYSIEPALRRKTLHTGYVTQCIPPARIALTRAARGIADDELWVVASAGGGQYGERLIEGCLELADRYAHLAFDIVMGPRSGFASSAAGTEGIGSDRIRLHRQTDQMPYLNAAADLVVSTGGYNTLLEALQGNGKILCFPYRLSTHDEPFRHVMRLRQFVDIEVSIDLSQLPRLFEQAVEALRTHRKADRRRELDFGGAFEIERIVRADLGQAEEEPR